MEPSFSASVHCATRWIQDTKQAKDIPGGVSEMPEGNRMALKQEHSQGRADLEFIPYTISSTNTQKV